MDLALKKLTTLMGQMAPYNTNHSSVAHNTPLIDVKGHGLERPTPRNSNPNLPLPVGPWARYLASLNLNFLLKMKTVDSLTRRDQRQVINEIIHVTQYLDGVRAL